MSAMDSLTDRDWRRLIGERDRARRLLEAARADLQRLTDWHAATVAEHAAMVAEHAATLAELDRLRGLLAGLCETRRELLNRMDARRAPGEEVLLAVGQGDSRREYTAADLKEPDDAHQRTPA